MDEGWLKKSMGPLKDRQRCQETRRSKGDPVSSWRETHEDTGKQGTIFRGLSQERKSRERCQRGVRARRCQKASVTNQDRDVLPGSDPTRGM